MPDRITFYNYAQIPWIKGNGQHGFNEKNLPTADVKRNLYEIGERLLAQAGYVEIGMDHFALRSDSLFMTVAQKTVAPEFYGLYDL